MGPNRVFSCESRAILEQQYFNVDSLTYLTTTLLYMTHFIPVSDAYSKKFLADALTDYWTTQWQARSDCRQTKIWFPTPNTRVSAKLVTRGRLPFSELVQTLTGHNFLNRHQHVIDPDASGECRLCMEDDESSWHVVAECPALARTRLSVFGSHALEAPPNWSPNQLARFLREPSMRMLFDQLEVE